MKNLTDVAIAVVKKDDPFYYKLYRLEVDEPFIFNVKNDLPLNKSFFDQENNTQKVDELYNTDCYPLLEGTVPNKDFCSTNDECLANSSKPNRTEYFITHQLLFFIMAKRVSTITKIIKSLLTDCLNIV